MSEGPTSGEGLKKLTEYLQQTRRQAEIAIDVLNERISEMQTENETCMDMISKLEKERDYYKDHYETVKIENSTKWKLRERDEWKALVENVQQDRDRLQDVCVGLEAELETAIINGSRLEEENKRFSSENERLTAALEESNGARSNITTNDTNGSTAATTEAPSSSVMSTPIPSSRKPKPNLNIDAAMTDVGFSPVSPRSGKEFNFNGATPNSVNKQLKMLLRKTQMEVRALKNTKHIHPFQSHLDPRYSHLILYRWNTSDGRQKAN